VRGRRFEALPLHLSPPTRRPGGCSILQHSASFTKYTCWRPKVWVAEQCRNSHGRRLMSCVAIARGSSKCALVGGCVMQPCLSRVATVDPTHHTS
jgi:hypothetical protein